MVEYVYNFMKIIAENWAIISILLVLIGWIFTIFLNRKNIKDQLKTQIKYDIYKQVTQIHHEIQGSLSKLSTASIFPFILMDSTFTVFKIIQKTELEALQEGWNAWNKHVKKALNDYSEFLNNYAKFLYFIEDWCGPLKKLKSAQKLLNEEIEKKREKIYKIISDCQTISIKRGYNWREWDKKEIEEIGNELTESVLNIECYLHDFIVLVHNELMAEYFKYKIETRKPQDKAYKVLTIKGFVTKDDIN